MSMPVRNLPLIQKWDCHSCSNCCREYDVAVTAEEQKRITEQGWDKDPAMAGVKLFHKIGSWWSRQTVLNHKKEGGCVFLDENNQCRIHARHGSQAKPLACRLYPFILIPSGDHWRVGMRYACPSAVIDEGRSIESHAQDLQRWSTEYEKQHGDDIAGLQNPKLQSRQSVDWADIRRFAKTLYEMLEQNDVPLEQRMRRCLALSQICRKAKFDAIQGKRLSEFLKLIITAVDDDTPKDPAQVPLPSASGRLLFRQFAAMYSRKDRGEWQGLVRRGRWALFLSGLRFAQGSGQVPKTNALIGNVTFADVDNAHGQLTKEMDELLTKFYLVKVKSLQFFGPTNFRLTFWDGFDALALTMPLILWLTRAIRSESPLRDLQRAISIVDDHFGFNPILAKGRFRFALRMLSGQGDIAKFVAFYGR